MKSRGGQRQPAGSPASQGGVTTQRGVTAQRGVDEITHDLRVDHLQGDAPQQQQRQQGKASPLRPDVAGKQVPVLPERDVFHAATFSHSAISYPVLPEPGRPAS